MPKIVKNRRVAVTVSLPIELLRRLDFLIEDSNRRLGASISRSTIIEKLLETWLETQTETKIEPI